MAEKGKASLPELPVRSAHSWSHITREPDDWAQDHRRRDLREFIIPLSVLHLDPADRKVIRIAGKFTHVYFYIVTVYCKC